MAQYTTTVIQCDKCPNKATAADARGEGLQRVGAFTHVTFPGAKPAQDYCQPCWTNRPDGQTPAGDPIGPGVEIGGF